jgi:hypothetical protein
MTSWVLREIDDEFTAAGISLASSTKVEVRSGARRYQVELYYASLDLTRVDDAAKLLGVFENVLATTSRSDGQPARGLLLWLEKDGYVYEGGRLHRRGPSAMQHLASKLSTMNDASVHDEIRRIEASIDADPALAIGSAKELIESVCKTILDAKGIAYAKTADLSVMVKATTTALKIAPDDIPSAAKGADLVKRTLHNLAAIVGNIGELRSLYGTGHGKSANAKGLQPRHARLVAGAASALVTFLWDTFERREANGRE